jgi:predicted Zn finger-like uncharacterized protein
MARLDYINQPCDSVTKMILVCPSCDTRYFAADTSLGNEGRKVRCTACGHSWFAKVDPEGGIVTGDDTGLTREQVERLRQTASASAASSAGPHAEFRARKAERQRRNRAVAAFSAWGIGLVLFGTAAASAVVFRSQVVDAWPKTASIYSMVGLGVNRFGLDFENVTARRSFDGTTPVLTVSGVAVNLGDTARPAPGVRISLRDEAGTEVGVWSDKLPSEAIQPGEKVEFTTRIVAPPVDTYRLAVTFESGADHATAPHDRSADVGVEAGEGAHEAPAGHEAPAHEASGAEAPGHEAPAPEAAGHEAEGGGHDEVAAAPETPHH